MPLIIPKDILDKDTIDTSECTHPAGHCFGNDGGSGIPQNMKVQEGRGGEFRVQKLSVDKEKLEEDAYYNRCQYCGHYTFLETKVQRDAKEKEINN